MKKKELFDISIITKLKGNVNNFIIKESLLTNFNGL